MIDLSKLDLEIDVEGINKYTNEQYALLRKHGLGTSDSSALCEVNPYVTLTDLIQEKCRNFLTDEEREVGNKTAVKKGRDLEPLIINKFAKIIDKPILKPEDMYHHKDYKWLKFNFDGVVDMGGFYVPSEIKVVTKYGEKHYDKSKCWFCESRNTFIDNPVNNSKGETITAKAAAYGIPPYYYTQLQQQIFGLNASYGYLTVLFDNDWEVVSFYVYRDDETISQILANGYKIWKKICKESGDEHREDLTNPEKVFGVKSAQRIFM